MAIMNDILLHVCCGPCSTVPLRLLQENSSSFSTFFFNPNIQPSEEYERRRATFHTVADSLEVVVIEGSYHPTAWDAALKARGGVVPMIPGDVSCQANRARREARCRACYAFRFEQLAACAEKRGFAAIATTLSISPYQFTDIIEAELLAAARHRGLASAFVDYRQFYPDSVKRAREAGLYRQNYCGCLYSKAEAEQERAAIKVARKQRQQSQESRKTKGESSMQVIE
jgi:predicted adenine nucleotide alpha hydrolase (AANH) superfamily ATPase